VACSRIDLRGGLGYLACCCRHGSPAQIERMDRVLDDRPGSQAAMRGELARVRGRPRDAIPMLEEAAAGQFTYAFFFSPASRWRPPGRI